MVQFAFATSIQGLVPKLLLCAIFVTLYFAVTTDFSGSGNAKYGTAAYGDPAVGALRRRLVEETPVRTLAHVVDYDPAVECPLDDCSEVPYCYDTDLNIGPNITCCDENFNMYGAHFPLEAFEDYAVSFDYLEEENLGVPQQNFEGDFYVSRQFVGQEPTCNAVGELADSGTNAFFNTYMRKLRREIGRRQLTCDYDHWELAEVNNDTVCRHQANQVLTNHLGEAYEVHLTTMYYDDEADDWAKGWDQGWCDYTTAKAGLCAENLPVGLKREIECNGLQPDGSLYTNFSHGLGGEFGSHQMFGGTYWKKGADRDWHNEVAIVDDPEFPEEGPVARLDTFVHWVDGPHGGSWEHAFSGELTSTRLFASGRYHVRARVPHSSGYSFGMWVFYGASPIYSDVRHPEQCSVWSGAMEAGDLKQCRYCLDALPTSASPFWLDKSEAPGRYTPTSYAEFLHSEVEMTFPALHNYYPQERAEDDEDDSADDNGDDSNGDDSDNGEEEEEEEDDFVDQMENDIEAFVGRRLHTANGKMRDYVDKDNSIGMHNFRWIDPAHEGTWSEMYAIGNDKFIGDGQYHDYSFEWHTGGLSPDGESREATVDYYVDGDYVGTNSLFVPLAAGRFTLYMYSTDGNGKIGYNKNADGEIVADTNMMGEEMDRTKELVHYSHVYISEVSIEPYYESHDFVLPSAFDQPNLNRRAVCSAQFPAACGTNPIVPYRTANFFPDNLEGDRETPCCGAVCMSLPASLGLSSCELGGDGSSNGNGDCPVGESTIPVIGSRSASECRCIKGTVDEYGDPTLSDMEYDVTCEWHVDKSYDFNPSECIKRDYPMEMDGYRDRGPWDVNLGCRYDINRVCVDPGLSEEEQLESCFEWLDENCGQVLNDTYFEAWVDRPAYRCRLYIRPPYQQPASAITYTNFPGLLPEDVDEVLLPEGEYFHGCRFNYIDHPIAYMDEDDDEVEDDFDAEDFSGCAWLLDYCPGATLDMFEIAVSEVDDVNGNFVCEMQRKEEFSPADPGPLEYPGSRATCDVDFEVFPPFCLDVDDCNSWSDDHCDRPENLTATCDHNICRFTVEFEPLIDEAPVPLCYQENPNPDSDGRTSCDWDYMEFPPCGTSVDDCWDFVEDHCGDRDNFMVELNEEADRNGNTACLITNMEWYSRGSPWGCEYRSCLQGYCDQCTEDDDGDDGDDTGDDSGDDTGDGTGDDGGEEPPEEEEQLLLLIDVDVIFEDQVNLTVFALWFREFLPDLVDEFNNLEELNFTARFVTRPDDDGGVQNVLATHINASFADAESRQEAFDTVLRNIREFEAMLQDFLESRVVEAGEVKSVNMHTALMNAGRQVSADGDGDDDSSISGAAIGGAAAGVAVIALGIVGLVFYRKRRSHAPATAGQPDTARMQTEATATVDDSQANADDPEGYPTSSHVIRDWQ